jgi:hypothetical protein
MDALPSSEGKLVNTNTRNARVVACLILAMTAGARMLLWLEPAPAAADQLLLAAVSGVPVEDVLIEYAQPGELPPPGACLIQPDGGCDPGRLGPRVHVVVVGSGQGPLPQEQKQTLLAVLRTMAWSRSGTTGAEAPAIHLHPGSDAAQARELSEMLVAKRFID